MNDAIPAEVGYRQYKPVRSQIAGFQIEIFPRTKLKDHCDEKMPYKCCKQKLYSY